MINYSTANTPADLEGILLLQNQNLPEGLTKEEIVSQGFVTVKHSYEQLNKLNKLEKHLVAKYGEKVIGYVLAMTNKSSYDLPILIPMFDLFDKIMYLGKIISHYHFIVVGQVCIDKNYRGQGIFDQCYRQYKKYYEAKYDFAITEIAGTNNRSRKAHKRIGFEEIHSYRSPDNMEWIIVLWDWAKG